jgi:hypothetical protein
MPALIRTVDEIMAREKRDMLFVQFRHPLLKQLSPNPSRQHHLAWFDAKGVPYELVAPRGWLGGDPGLFAVYFSGLDDPQIAAYSAAFETPDGKSLASGDYQMVIVTYTSWLDRRS